MPLDPTQAVIETVRTAWQAGRPVVPILGAGLSADAGIPVVATLQRYLCKYHQYLKHHAYLPGLAAMPGNPLDRLRDRYTRKPWECLAEVGWPDRYDLAQCLQGYGVEKCVQTAESELVQRINEWGDKQLSDIREELAKKLDALPTDARVTIAQAIDEQLLRTPAGRSVAYKLFINWRRLIQHFTNYRPELADELFHRLAGGRHPSLSHRYLAFLVKLLGVRAVFTFNFDDLIERALHAEGVDFRTFDMEHGGALPYPALTRDMLAVVKMHGSTHALLLDERLDYPLADEYKGRFRDLVGRHPLLLVAGFGTDERRLFDLLETTLTEDRLSRLCWLHFEDEQPSVLATFAGRPEWAGRVQTTAYANPGLLFQHLYAALVGRHPASQCAYTAHVSRPYSFRPPNKGTLDPLAREPFLIVSSAGTKADSYPPHTASERLVDLATHGVRAGFQPLWVDLEASHTLAAVVGSIIDQCRALDTQLAPSVMPLGELTDRQRADGYEWNSDPVVQSAARRVAEALGRSRYLVLLDGLEAYLWPPLVHHGEVSRSADRGRPLLNELGGFLLALKQALGNESGSRVVLGVDRSHARDGEQEQSDDITAKYDELLARLNAGGWTVAPLNDACRPFTDTFKPASTDRPLARVEYLPLPESTLSADVQDLIWLTLSCVRRGRPLATVRRLLRPFARGHEVDDVIATLTTAEPRDDCGFTPSDRLGLTRLEGGGLWYHRPVRDHVYAANSRGCGTRVMTELLAEKSGRPEDVRLAAAQAALLAATHLRVSSVYYSNVYLQSRDAVAFLEYTYHRQSGVRYLTKLLALLARDEYVMGVLAGLGRAGQYGWSAQGVVPNDGWLRLWEGLFTPAEAEASPIALALRGREIDRTALITELAEVHRREVGALARAWVRAEPVLRVQLPAQQLVAWCDAFIGTEASHLLHRVPVSSATDGVTAFADADLEARAKQAVDRLVEAITDFKVKMLYDRADYRLAADARLALLEAPEHRPAWAIIGRTTHALRKLLAGGEGSDEAVRAMAAELSPERASRHLDDREITVRRHLRHVHWLLDVAACVIKLRQERGTETGSETEATAVLTVLDALVERVSAAGPGGGDVAAESDLVEARLRLYYFRAEASLGDVCVFTQDIGFLGRPPGVFDRERPGLLDRIRETMTAAEGYVGRGLASMRAAPPRADGRLRSLMLDPIDGGWLYLPYRSAFHTAQGRLRWLRAARTAGLPRQEVDEGFRTAFECFDLARGGLDGNHQVAALTELFRVEACLARGRMLLYPPEGGQSDLSTGDRIDQAVAKYEAARIGLQAARKHLLTGRRNVIWWKLFYALAAQYHADRLLAGVARLVDAPSDGSGGAVRLWEVVARLRRGYQTVRAGLDLRLTTGDSTDQGWRWIGRTWAEMTAAAYLTGRLLLTHAAKEYDRQGIQDHPTVKMSEDERHKAVYYGLRGLNFARRLDPDCDEDLAGANADWKDGLAWYRGLLTCGTPDPQEALTVWLNVLRRALDPMWEAGWQPATSRAVITAE